MVVAARDIKCGETVLVDTPCVIGHTSEDIMENIRMTGEVVIEILDVIKEDESRGQMILNLSDHLEARRKENVWREVTDFIVPWVTSQPGKEKVSSEMIERIVGITRTNSIKWSRGGQSGSYAVCPVFAMINHSCISNAVDVEMEDGRMEVRAVVDIQRGEEVTIQYRSGMMPSLSRRMELLEFWRFECHCPRCEDRTEMRTMASGVMCDTCTGVILPDTCHVSSTWSCNTCGVSHDPEFIKNIINQCQSKISSINSSTTAEQVELLLTEFQTKLHRNHSLCLNLQRLLISLYGSKNDPDDEQFLPRQNDLCRQFIGTMSILEPGLRSWLGPVVKELMLNMTRQVNRDMINNNIDKMEYVKKLAEIINWM